MIAVIGSVNIDISARVPHLPAPGETVLGGTAQIGLGGKGANQAVAATRLLAPGRAPVRLIACVGTDSFGDEATAQLGALGVNLNGLHRVTEPTGLALIGVDRNAQNSIIVAPGANSALEPRHVAAEMIQGASLVCVSLEIPEPTWRAAIRSAQQVGAPIVVNASPLDASIRAEDFAETDVLVVNQFEAHQLTGAAPTGDSEITRALETARGLRRVAPRVVVTLGARGAVWADQASGHEPAPTVNAVDTTGAGDTFCGALCVALEDGASLVSAVRFANLAGAFCATRSGTTRSMPTRTELEAFQAHHAATNGAHP